MKYGYFDDHNKEYVITDPKTPYPWINYLGNEDFFSLISNTAGGYTFYKDAKYIRRRSVDNVIKELRQIRKESHLNYVVFLDDTFTVNRAWVKAFCHIYGREIGTGFSINAQAVKSGL